MENWLGRLAQLESGENSDGTERSGGQGNR